jgi:hypothetical protein
MNKKFLATTFTEKEGFILDTVWQGPKDSHSTYSLTLNQGISMNAPNAAKIFDATEEAIEHLVELGLIRGERLKDAAGKIYFGDLKLTNKGEQETIRHRKLGADFKQHLATVADYDRVVTDEIKKATEKNKQ